MKDFFWDKIENVENYTCNLMFPELENNYAVFRRYKNGKILLLKIFKTARGARNHAYHRNSPY